MGSNNFDGTNVSQARTSLRNIGRAYTVSAERVETETSLTPPPEERSSDLGTGPDEAVTQRNILGTDPLIKETESIGDTVLSRTIQGQEPTATDQPEIALLPVSQRSTINTGTRVVTRQNTDGDLVGRDNNTGAYDVI